MKDVEVSRDQFSYFEKVVLSSSARFHVKVSPSPWCAQKSPGCSTGSSIANIVFEIMKDVEVSRDQFSYFEKVVLSSSARFHVKVSPSPYVFQ